ncbi:MAG: hypothetical protein ACREA4_02065 [Nitrososphaera sp.]
MIDLVIGTFILDFQSVDFEPDSRVALQELDELQRGSQLERAFAMDSPVQSAGWSFAKLFFSGQFVEKIYARHRFEIDSAKGKKFEDKFIAWFGALLKNKGCGAQLKMAPEMKAL